MFPTIHIIRQKDWKIGLLKKLRLVTVPPPSRATCGRPTSPRRLERRRGFAHSPGDGERSMVQSVPVDRPKSDGRRPHKARSGGGPTKDMIVPDRGRDCVSPGGGEQERMLHSSRSVASESGSITMRPSSPPGGPSPSIPSKSGVAVMALVPPKLVVSETADTYRPLFSPHLLPRTRVLAGNTSAARTRGSIATSEDAVERRVPEQRPSTGPAAQFFIGLQYHLLQESTHDTSGVAFPVMGLLLTLPFAMLFILSRNKQSRRSLLSSLRNRW